MAATQRKNEQRRELIRRRLALAEGERERANAAIGTACRELIQQHQPRIVAAFIAHRGEPDLSAVMGWLVAEDRIVVLPVVNGPAMRFCRWTPGTKMQVNRFGIGEPVSGEEYDPAQIDLVLMPLVGFAPDGTRLGMGAGYYDRSFAFRRQQPDALVRLVGVAYAVQEMPVLPADPWDVPLDAVVTEEGLRCFSASGPRVHPMRG